MNDRHNTDDSTGERVSRNRPYKCLSRCQLQGQRFPLANGWFAALAHDRGGEKAKAAAWERIAALPGSWRAQLWLACTALEAHDTPGALAFYRQSLRADWETVPADFLKQMSGDLGNAWRLSGGPGLNRALLYTGTSRPRGGE